MVVEGTCVVVTLTLSVPANGNACTAFQESIERDMARRAMVSFEKAMENVQLHDDNAGQ